MLWLLSIHVLIATVAVLNRRRLGQHAFLLCALGPAAVVLWAVAKAPGIVAGQAHVETLTWVPMLNLVLDFRVDAYALLFLLVIGIAGVVIFTYANSYFGADPRVALFAATMTIFGGAMVGLVTSDHLLAVFVFWELTTITSYLLIGYNDHLADARSAALHAALVTGAGGLAMLGGLVLLGMEANTFSIADIVANPPAGSTAVALAWVLVLLGAVTKSAQFPFHGWLPGAMAAPTPASAFLHSATMVKAGIFLAGRLAPAAIVSTTWWQPAVIVIGLATMVVGGWQALRQHDLKLLLAFGTVSQLGFLFLLIASGDPLMLFGGLALLAAHALYKAALFMVVGTIDHEVGTRDLRELAGLRRAMPAVFWTAVAAATSMAAVPLTYGFVAKEAAFDALLLRSPLLVAAAAAASVLTVAYAGRFLIGAFGGRDATARELSEPRSALLWAPLMFGATGLLMGLYPGVVAPLVTEAAAGAKGKLVVWPGLVPALAWSLGSLIIGLVIVRWPAIGDHATATVARVSDRLPTATQSFQRAVHGTLHVADKSSGLLQNGSLPSYVTIILLTAVLLPATAMIRGGPSLETVRAGGPLEFILGALIAACAIAMLVIRRRFAAVILLGGVGYGVAGLFAVLGGPDLSITQLLVETLAVALFAMVLRYLPATFARARSVNTLKVTVALSVAVFVFVGGLLMHGARQEPAVSRDYVALSVPEAGGANVVNVILVDFRGLDTLGEITVLTAAALGAAGLVLPVIRRREKST